MAPKYRQSPDELKAHLVDQITALEISASAFDSGTRSEAKRLAQTVRVLVHDKPGSPALLDQLGKKTELYLSTTQSRNENSPFSYMGLLGIEMVPGQPAEYFAPLDEKLPTSTPRWISFAEWWDEVIRRQPTAHRDPKAIGAVYLEQRWRSPC